MYNTSVKGVSRLFKANSFETRILWSCCVLYNNWIYIVLLHIGRIFQLFYCDSDYRASFSSKGEYACNLNPSGTLENIDLLGNKTYSICSEMVENKTACEACSGLEKKHLNSLKAEMLTANSYIRFAGMNRMKNLFQNINDFLIDCTLHLSRINCLEVTEISMELSGQYFVCWNIEFPIDLSILAVSMTFYMNNDQPSGQTYQRDKLWNMKSAGVVYEVSEPHLPSKKFIPLQTAPTGMMTSVNVHKIIKNQNHIYPARNSSHCRLHQQE